MPFVLGTQVLTSLLHGDKKLIVSPELKGEATVEIYLNGILQVLDGGKRWTTVTDDPLRLMFEIE